MSLLDKIKSHTVEIAVIGAGYVGLPLALEMSKNNKVILFDVDKKKIDSIEKGRSYISDVTDTAISRAVNVGSISATCNEKMLEKADCFIICVPTPLNKNKQPELKYIISATNNVVKHMRKQSLIVLESTTYPGTTEELVKPIFEYSGKEYGVDFFLAFSPERVDPGNKEFNTLNTTKVVGGVCPVATELARTLYEANLKCDVFTVSSPAVAEMSKILENTYRNINIALIDEFACICHKMGIDVWEVVEAAKTKPFGFKAFYPGPGVGGHCIPLDPLYLAWKVKEYGMSLSLVETSEKILNNMPKYIVSRVVDILNDIRLPVCGSKILVVGVAYKEDISDYRESPALDIIKELKLKNAEVSYFDPLVKSVLMNNTIIKSVEDDDVFAQKWDLIVIITGHSEIDYCRMIELNIPLFDTRNILKEYHSNNIIKL